MNVNENGLEMKPRSKALTWLVQGLGSVSGTTHSNITEKSSTDIVTKIRQACPQLLVEF